MSYITLEKAQNIVAKYASCDYNEDLDDLLAELTVYLEQWLGYSMAPKQYVEKCTPNHRSILYLRHNPVISIESIKYLIPQIVPPQPGPIEYDAYVFSNGKNEIDVTGYRNCCGLDAVFMVTYTAGYDPLPDAICIAAARLLREVISNGGDFNLLAMPYRDLKKLETPDVNGNIRQEWNSANISAGTTTIDMVLKPLIGCYKKTVWT